MRYTIEQFTTPTTYDDPWQPDPNWMESPFFYGKSWKTEQGATRAPVSYTHLRAHET